MSARTSSTSAAATRGSSSRRCATTGSRAWSSCPQVLDLFWSAIEREVEKRGRTVAFERLRGDRPAPADRPSGALLFRSVHRQLGGAVPAVPVVGRVPAARAPAGAGRTSASPSSRATARPRPGPARARRSTTTGLGTVGRVAGGHRDAPRRRTARSSSAAGPCSAATGTRPELTAAGLHRGRLVPDRRHRPLRRRGPARS